MALEGLKRLLASLTGGGNGSRSYEGMISCDEALERLFEYLDGELTDASSEEVERHAEVCKVCYPRLQFERHFLDALHAAEQRGGASRELKDRILRVLAEEGLQVST